MRFQDDGHIYALSPDGKVWADKGKVQSVTGLLKTYVEKFTPMDPPLPAMERQRVRGVKMHALIERYLNGDAPIAAEISNSRNTQAEIDLGYDLDMTHEYAGVKPR